MRRTQTVTKDDEVFDRGESMLWLASFHLGAQGCNPRRGDEFSAPFLQSGTCWNSSKDNTRSIYVILHAGTPGVCLISSMHSFVSVRGRAVVIHDIDRVLSPFNVVSSRRL